MIRKSFLTKCGVVLGGLFLFLTVDVASQGRLCGTRTLLSANTGLVRHERRVAFLTVSEESVETWVSREIEARGRPMGEIDWTLVRFDMPMVWLCQLSRTGRTHWLTHQTGQLLGWAQPNDEVFLRLKGRFVDAFLKQDYQEMRDAYYEMSDRVVATDPEGG